VFLLDTSTLISANLYPKRLGKYTRNLIRRSPDIFFSAVSVFEIVAKQMKGKLNLGKSVFEFLAELDARSLPLRVEDAAEVYSFPSLIKHDPFDRLILATTKAHNAKLITSDQKLLNLGFDWILDSSI
jgi:PIN domain nuclease of toxin-antitoxin system